MESVEKKARLSAGMIRDLYFGNQIKESQSVVSHDCDIVGTPELTPTARYVMSEVRKRLGEYLAAHELSFSIDDDLLTTIILQVENVEKEELSERERAAIVHAVKVSRLNYDVLTSLVENPEINDIIVRAYNDVSVQVSGRRNVSTDVSFTDHASYQAFVEQLLKRVGKCVSTALPVVDAAIEPDVRACVTHESFSPPGSGPMLTLRIARHRDITLEGLINHKLAPAMILDYLGAMISSGKFTGLIAGEVGTGKTTLVKALASQMPEDEAVLVIEDTYEIVLKRKFVRTLLTREANTEGAGEITPAEAIRTGMRMAMNRIILGEMRDGSAAEAFIDVCSSGHSGLSTIHARSARDALARLELFLSRIRAGSAVEHIRREIANAVGIVVYMDIDRSGVRRIIEIVEVGSAADGPPQLQPIFIFDDSNDTPQWRRGGGLSMHNEHLKTQGVTLPQPNSVILFNSESQYEQFRH